MMSRRVCLQVLAALGAVAGLFALPARGVAVVRYYRRRRRFAVVTVRRVNYRVRRRAWRRRWRW